MKAFPLFIGLISLMFIGCNMPLEASNLDVKAGGALGASMGSNSNLNIKSVENHLGEIESFGSESLEPGNFLITVTENYIYSTATETPILTSTIGQSPTTTLTPTIIPSATITPVGYITSTATQIFTPTSTNTIQPQQSPTNTKVVPKTSTQTATQKASPTITKTISPSKTATQTQIPSKTPTPTKTLVPTNTNTPVPHTCLPVVNTSFEDEVVNLINQERANAGVAPLTVHSSLTSAARSHSQDMACNGFFSHTSPTTGSAFDRILTHGYTYSWAGENIIAGYSTPAYSVAWWMNSQAHKDNILNPNFTNIGIGYAYSEDSHYGTYFTANFGRP